MKLIDCAEAWIVALESAGYPPPTGDSWEPYFVDYLALIEENK